MDGVLLIILLALVINYFFWKKVYQLYTKYKFFSDEKKRLKKYNNYNVFTENKRL